MSFDPQRLKHLFLEAALITDSAQRQAWLAEQCGPDADLLAKVQSLLKAREDPESFLDRLAPSPDPPSPVGGEGAPPFSSLPSGGEGLGVRGIATVDEPAITERPGT